MQNGFVESFNGRLRDECLNEHLFNNLNEARQIIEAWRIDYNTSQAGITSNRLIPNSDSNRACFGRCFDADCTLRPRPPPFTRARLFLMRLAKDSRLRASDIVVAKPGCGLLCSLSWPAAAAVVAL